MRTSLIVSIIFTIIAFITLGKAIYQDIKIGDDYDNVLYYGAFCMALGWTLISWLWCLISFILF